jgi:hypothetical protein
MPGKQRTYYSHARALLLVLPLFEVPLGYTLAMPNLGLSAAEDKAKVDWIISPALAGANDEARVEPITPDRLVEYRKMQLRTLPEK